MSKQDKTKTRVRVVCEESDFTHDLDLSGLSLTYPEWKMVRKLKHHEQKLLKKVDFINWEVDNNLHEVKVMKRSVLLFSNDNNRIKTRQRSAGFFCAFSKN